MKDSFKNAIDGMSAINLATEFHPHIVVLDVMMPGMDGWEVCRLLKKKYEQHCYYHVDSQRRSRGSRERPNHRR